MSEEVKEEKNPIDCIFDEDNTDPIVLYNEKGEPVEFEQVAVIPLDERVYAILKPIKEMEGIGENEALVFEVVETASDEEEDFLALVVDVDTIDRVFKVYDGLVDGEAND